MYAYSLILNIVVSPDTSDVQMVCGVLTQEKATVLCSFSEGSLAIGCQVTLALELNNETVHHFTRDPSSRLAMGHLSVEISAVSDGGYMLYASDIEPDGTIGEIRIEGNFSTSCSHNDLPAGGEIIFFAHFMCTVNSYFGYHYFFRRCTIPTTRSDPIINRSCPTGAHIHSHSHLCCSATSGMCTKSTR